jgi:hypothetical protein
MAARPTTTLARLALDAAASTACLAAGLLGSVTFALAVSTVGVPASAAHPLPGAEDARQVAVERLARAADLIAGSVTLAEAVAADWDAGRDRPTYLLAIRAGAPGAGDEEAAARNTVGFVLAQIDNPAFREEVRRRLAGELDVLYVGADAAPVD